MRLNLIGPFVVNSPFGTEIAFAKGLRREGHEVIEVDPNVDRALDGMDQSADATVVFKSCCGGEAHLKRLKGPVVVYQPDDARFPHIVQMMLMMRRYSDLFLSFDEHSTRVAQTMGYRVVETLLLTADDELYCPPPDPVERDIDVSFIGSLGDPVAHASRRHMLQYIMERNERYKFGWRVEFGTTQDIPTVVDIYRRSKVVLNHATDVGQAFGRGFGLQCRHFEVGMTGTALLSNAIIGHVGHPPGLPFPTFEDEGELLDKIDAIVNGPWSPEEIGKTLHDAIMVSHRPEHRARQLVDFIGRNS